MKKRLLFSMAFILVAVSFSFAQDPRFTGHWTGKVMGRYKLTYDFVASGDSLTGTDTHRDGSVSAISNGKIRGDSISYDVPLKGIVTHVTGKLEGDVLTIYFKYRGYNLSAGLKKTAPDIK